MTQGKVRWGILGCGRIARHAIAPACRWSQNGVLHGGETKTFRVPGANHFLHQVEHFAALVLDPSRAPDPAESGSPTRLCSTRSPAASASAASPPSSAPQKSHDPTTGGMISKTRK